MQTKAQEQFNDDYLFLRSMVLRGVAKVEDAKLWIKIHGDAAFAHSVIEQQDKLSKKFGTRVERDFEDITEEERRLEKEDE